MDSRALAHRLEGETYTVSRQFRKLLGKEPFQRFPSDHEESYQEKVHEWCRWFSENDLGRFGLPPKMGGEPQKFLCLGYELGLFDFSFMMKFGLQFGFVMRAISRLGSTEQLNLLEALQTMECSACFAMTEVDHGSNVKALQTTATYRPETEDYLLDTPHPGACKDWVAGLAHASHALVFARLLSLGTDHGVHAFWVSLRQPNGQTREGVKFGAERKMLGLGGLNYGLLSFQGVTLSKESLLSRYAQIDSSGHYRTLLKSESSRFNAMMGTLVVGRALIAGGAAAGAKKALTIAVSYTSRRRQFRSGGESVERTVLSYQAVQRSLMPALATLLAVDAGRGRLAQSHHDYMENSVKDRELESFTASFKSYVSQFAVECAELCRKCCGGAGCSVESGLPNLPVELSMFTTMEGDNTVLDLMVARNLLTEHSRGLTNNFVKALGWVGKNVSRATQTGPLRSRDASSARLTSTDYLSAALRFRRDRLKESLAKRVKSRLARSLQAFDALNECQDHSLALSKAYCEDKIFRSLRNLTESCPPGWDKRALETALSLFGISRLDSDRGWYLEQGYISRTQSESIRRETLVLCAMMAEHAEAIIEAFELTDHQLASSLVLKSSKPS